MIAVMADRRHWHSTPGYRSWCGPCRYERQLGDARFLALIVAALLLAALLLGIAMQAADRPVKRYVPLEEVGW